jgi:diguanylate cyclase (GGDEF)-like protein
LIPGDEYLKKVAVVLVYVVERDDDLPARYGGEEFALILENTLTEVAMKIAETIRQRVIDLHLENKQFSCEQYLTVSIGAATVVQDKEVNSAHLIS